MKVSFTSWFVLLLLFIATGLSFLDRQVLSITIIKIQTEFDVTDVQYGLVNTSFLISYALMFTIGGRLMDLVGSKIGLGVSVAIWSLAIGLHGVMNSFVQLLLLRFLLGIGEGGCFPGAIKTVYEWFDEKRRALANGIAIGGSAIGAVIAPPLTILISENLGWRWSFLIPFFIGIAWVALWFCIPWKKKPYQVFKLNEPKERVKPEPFFRILRNKDVAAFMLIRFLLDPVVYFIMFWAPKYLHDERGIAFERVGNLFWIPFLALGISNILGGWISDRLIRRGVTVNRARKSVMGMAALMTAAAPFIVWATSAEMAVGMLSVVMFAHGLWITNYITSIADIFGAKGTATVVGLSGTAGALSGLLLNPVIGWVAETYSYTPLWLISGTLYPLAFLVFILTIPRIRSMVPAV